MQPKINRDICDGEGTCVDVCPTDPNVFELQDGKAVAVHPEACIECGVCEAECPTGAITLE
jgi:NAD-dependent dihydropyrimidine dehydrogenase PreA subunit